MKWSDALLAGLVLGLAACGQAQETQPLLPPESMTRDPEVPPPVEVPAAVESTRQDILGFTKRGSLSGLARFAEGNEGFVSNLEGTPHREFWDLLRRTGIDPNLKLKALFDQPVGRRDVDGETWYIWPDLAAKDPGDLIPEKLSFQDRKRLRDLIGEDGVNRIRQGEAYPGMRTAIAEDGRWVYFVLGLDGEE
ncbi:MAG: hypothetical protein R3C13_13500 [Hyphomonas sp.]|uniref:hypothetical protein n=1 Tax=Hyphomonas sp. TaxID=87 RepID=UPI0035295283